ncbi:MAG: hypothetical protein COW65_08180 [Cytophagales bacterium CG18_big_fil_WC_8_21_14_2_50_42_9]|nr:MAG: hypothetical protein COW65_08180 [Cytophagales bacterium CG18_big_fil_WC_8_21_14_2_50_42_9]
MKNIKAIISVLCLLLLVTMSSCDLVGDIMEFTMWSTLIVVAIVILLVMWIIRKLRGPRNRI